MNVEIPNLRVFKKSHNFSKKQPKILATLGVNVYAWCKVDKNTENLNANLKQLTYIDILHQTGY